MLCIARQYLFVPHFRCGLYFYLANEVCSAIDVLQTHEIALVLHMVTMGIFFCATQSLEALVVVNFIVVSCINVPYMSI